MFRIKDRTIDNVQNRDSYEHILFSTTLFFIIQSRPIFRHFIPPCPKYSPKQPVLKHPQSTKILKVARFFKLHGHTRYWVPASSCILHIIIIIIIIIIYCGK
jgi:hypothetical protein